MKSRALPSNAMRLLRVCGLLISAIAVVWVAQRFMRSGALDVLRNASMAPRHAVVLSLCGGAIAYALAMCLPALAWWRMMAALSKQATSLRAVMATYAVSQYGKYLPGNVAHYALRHAWSRSHGIPHADLGLASIVEAALLLLVALSLTLLADAHQLAAFSSFSPSLAISLLLLAVIALGLLLQWARRQNVFSRIQVPELPTLRVLLFCSACYGGFLLACAALMLGLAHATGIPVDSFATLVAAVAASWLAGFVVVGAPAGLGVREAAFVALTGTALGEGRALLLIGLFRVVTFLGDTLFLAAGAIALRTAGHQARSTGA